MRFHLEICAKTLKRSTLLANKCSIIATTSNLHTYAARNPENFDSRWGSSNMLLMLDKSVTKAEKKYIRTRHPDDKKDKSEFENEKETNTNETSQSGSEKTEKEGKPTVDPKMIRKLRIYILVVAGLSFVSSFILLSQMFTGDRNIAEGLTSEDFTRSGISFDQFIQKYLNHGEVKRIVFLPSNNRAVAILHPGAFVDGKPVEKQSIIVEYPQNAQNFWADIRKAEGELGIGLSQGVQIDLYQGMTTFKVVELLIGVVILAWLGTQYGRLLRKRLLENRKNSPKN